MVLIRRSFPTSVGLFVLHLIVFLIEVYQYHRLIAQQFNFYYLKKWSFYLYLIGLSVGRLALGSDYIRNTFD